MISRITPISFCVDYIKIFIYGDSRLEFLGIAFLYSVVDHKKYRSVSTKFINIFPPFSAFVVLWLENVQTKSALSEKENHRMQSHDS